MRTVHTLAFRRGEILQRVERHPTSLTGIGYSFTLWTPVEKYDADQLADALRGLMRLGCDAIASRATGEPAA